MYNQVKIYKSTRVLGTYRTCQQSPPIPSFVGIFRQKGQQRNTLSMRELERTSFPSQPSRVLKTKMQMCEGGMSNPSMEVVAEISVAIYGWPLPSKRNRLFYSQSLATFIQVSTKMGIERIWPQGVCAYARARAQKWR